MKIIAYLLGGLLLTPSPNETSALNVRFQLTFRQRTDPQMRNGILEVHLSCYEGNCRLVHLEVGGCTKGNPDPLYSDTSSSGEEGMMFFGSHGGSGVDPFITVQQSAGGYQATYRFNFRMSGDHLLVKSASLSTIAPSGSGDGTLTTTEWVPLMGSFGKFTPICGIQTHGIF